MTERRILIVDGHNIFIRCWSIVPQMNVNGDHCGGVVGFLRSLKCLLRDTSATDCIVVWDGPGGSQKRRGVYAEYKAGRKPRVNREYEFDQTVGQSFDDLRTQMAKTRNYLDRLGISQVEVQDIEADDVIAYICRFIYNDVDKIVASSDKDFLQLVDRHTLVYSPSKKMYYTSGTVRETFNVIPQNFIYLKALMGDGSDNISGVKGIGEKTAVKMFPFMSERETDLNEIIAHAKLNYDKNQKYRDVYDQRDMLICNVNLMQLTSPIISSQSASSIRYSLRPVEKTYVISEVKLMFLRDGIQLTDADFFSVFKDFKNRNNKNGEMNV